MARLLDGRSYLLWVLVLVTSSVAVLAGETADEKAGRPAPCSGPEHRQFDFWLGEWDVWTERIRQNGGPPARSRITRILGGCALLEEYDAPWGYHGRSLSFYDKGAGVWRQTWADTTDTPTQQFGGLVGGSMVLQRQTEDGLVHEMRWKPKSDGTVEQRWRSTHDGGKTWTVRFDGTYEPRTRPGE